MIGRTDSLIAASPTTLDLDAAERDAERRINQQEREHAARIAAAPLPAVPRATADLMRREALARLGVTPERAADLAAYSVARGDGSPPEQTGPDGHPIIRGR